jgi:molybdopterin synthase catalytic subunit
MAISIWEVLITNDPLQSPGQTFNDEAGAVVDFWGIVRLIEDDREITGIDYESHRPMAEHQMNLLAKKARTDFSLSGLILRHRIGFVPAGEPSLFLRVASGHRTAAFAASQWLIEELKRNVPIWKKPAFKDATVITKERKLAAIVTS